MEHPLIGDAKALSDQELADRISDLMKKISIARRTGNGMLVNQVQMALQTYQNEHRGRCEEQYRKAMSQTDFDRIINITRE
nr:hypothetical protein [Oxalobacteraceae bacterium]